MSRLLKTKDKTILKLDKPVVVLDLATNAIFALNAIKKMLPYENILHISDFEKDSYEAHDADVPLDISAIVESVLFICMKP